jgi:hypothetical protein
LYGVIHKYEFPQEAVEIVIDRFLYGAAQKRFDNYLADGLMRSINVSHLDSKQCPCLQATDFIARAIARKYRDNDYLYYNKIQHKIIMALEVSKTNKRRLVNPSLIVPPANKQHHPFERDLLT